MGDGRAVRGGGAVGRVVGGAAGGYSLAMNVASAPPLLIWTEARRAPLTRRLAAALGDAVSIVAVGGPRRGEVAELADTLGVASSDDLRQMRIDHPASHLLVVGAAGVKRDDVVAALAEGTHVFTLEPLAADADPAGADVEPTRGRLRQLPLLRFSPAYLAAAEPTQAIGRVEAISIAAAGPADELSLFARLADTIDFAIALIGVPDQIDATLTGGLVEPPEQLRGLAGHMTVNLHAADRAGAAICVSDRSPVHHRRATVIGRTGLMHLDDHAYALHARAEGEPPLDEREGDAGPTDTAALVAEQLRYFLRGTAQREPVDRRAVIGCCEAALLSTRTGQSESTDRVLRIA